MNLVSEFTVTFQLTGSIILLFWCFSKISKNAIKMCFPGSNIVSRDENNNCIIKKELLQQKTKVIFLNAYSFICLTIGYLLSVFDGDKARNCWTSLTIVSAMTFLMILLGYWFAIIFSKTMYKKDIEIPYEELEKLGVDTYTTDKEIIDMINSTIEESNDDRP